MKNSSSASLDPFEFHPELIGQDVFVAKTATITGEVTVGDRSTILFGAVLRGDTAKLQIGNESNIQDLCCLHADPGLPCTLGNRVTVGHRAIVHGATVADNVLIGIGAIVLNAATIGEWSIIAAGALVPEGKTIPPRSMVMGIPGKVVREVTEDEIAMIRRAADHYIETGRQYRIRGHF